MTPTDITKSQEIFEKLRKAWQKLSRPIRVLLVEDDKYDAALIERALNGNRVDLTLALTGTEAIQRLGNDEFDLCLLDLKLVDLDGAGVIKWVREHNLSVPIVVLTGMADNSSYIKDALNAGAQCIFQKPLTPENVSMIFGGL